MTSGSKVPTRHSMYGARFETTETFRHPIPPAEGPVDFRYESGEPPPGVGELSDSAPAFRSRYTTERGRPLLTFHRGDRFDLFRFSDVVDFYVGDDLIRSVVHDSTAGAHVELYFMGAILSHWMERRHRPVLHAAVVVHEGRSIAFLAGNKSGKSSLAVGCLSAGCSLLSDDLLPLDERSDGFWAHPGYPELRLWPEAVRATGLANPRELPRVNPDEEKRRVPVGGPRGVGRFASKGAPLSAIFLPIRGAPDTDIRIRRIEPRGKALRELLGGSFLIPFPRAIGVEGSRMETLGRLVLDVPVCRLDYPAGWDRLPRVAEAVLEHVHGS